MKLFKYVILILIGIILIIFLINNKTQKKSFSVIQDSILATVDSKNFEQYINSGEYTVIDIRTPEEIALGKITANALEINFYDDTFKQQIAELNPGDKYLVYCRSGNRSNKSLDVFSGLGFSNVRELDGGIVAWDEYQSTKKEDDMNLMSELTEQEFIKKMIPHHEEAIATAQETLERGATTQDVKTLLQNIIEAQTSEVADMKSWYQDWYSTPYIDNGKYQPMMRDLENLSGVDIDRAFLEDMIDHHMGAIMMANGVQKYIEHDEMRELTKNIRITQTEEITEMRQLLREI